MIFANSVMEARTNDEGGPAALAAGLTGRPPRCGYPLPQHRMGTVLVEVEDQPNLQSDWDALGCYVGRLVNNYWEVSVFSGLKVRPTIDQLKRLGASLASFGSLAMFHMVGVTPEAATVDQAFGGRQPARRLIVPDGALKSTYESFIPEQADPDLVVFSAPRLSILELRDLAMRLQGKKVHSGTKLIVTTNDAYYLIAKKLGYFQIIDAAGGQVLVGTCFYLMTPRELAERFGYRTIVTDSAKLANIIAGYGYNPVFRPRDVCIEVALTGKIPW